MDELTLAVSSLTFLSLHEKIILYKNLDSLDNLALMSIKDISKAVGRSVNPEFWDGRTTAALAKKSAVILKNKTINYVLFEDEEYPSLLKEIFDPPFILFYNGNIKVLENKCVSVVGTRKVCAESVRAAFDFSKEAANEGFTVVSGLAYGTDGYAHNGAVASCEEGGIKGSTVAILPSGIDIVTPSAHKVLASRILKNGGCIASEYLPGTPAEAFRYVQRNRIIAGLSPATVVIQAPPASGALLTADFAIDYNRDLFFHSACFCEEAKKTADLVERQIQCSGKKGVEKKLNRRPELYLEDGAPVINNYAEFVSKEKIFLEAGSRKNKKQLQLF